MALSRPCGVRESPAFLEMVEALFESIRVWDEIKWAVESDVTRDPEAFELIPNTPGWRGVTLLTRPPRTLCFRYEPTEEQIYLEAIF